MKKAYPVVRHRLPVVAKFGSAEPLTARAAASSRQLRRRRGIGSFTAFLIVVAPETVVIASRTKDGVTVQIDKLSGLRAGSLSFLVNRIQQPKKGAFDECGRIMNKRIRDEVGQVLLSSWGTPLCSELDQFTV